MRLVENETRQVMNTRRNFVNYATMTLHDGTVLNLTPADFRISGNSFTDDWVDGDSFQIGSAIGKTATLLLDNTDGRTEIVGSSTVTYPHGKFSEYDFYMAYFTLYVCLPDAYHYEGELRDQMIRIGRFTVVNPVANSSTIEITGVDNMYMFDKSFDDCTLNFDIGVSLLTILNTCCQDCNVPIGYGSFDNQNLTVNKKPEGVTYRQVVSYIAQMAGCNAKITETGALTLVSYNMSALDSLDGGSFRAIGEEYLHRYWTWAPGGSESSGYFIYFATNRISRSGRYKITKINISNISDPEKFDANCRILNKNSLNYGMNSITVSTDVDIPVVAGDNILNYEFEISEFSRTIYWVGLYINNYDDPEASSFNANLYIEPISYNDLDSADGGSFEAEFQYYDPIHWVRPAHPSTQYYNFYKTISYQLLKPAGVYNITRAYIDNIEDLSHFNATWTVQKSVDSGSTWTDEQTGNLVAGNNIINFDIDLPEDIETRYRVRYRQNIGADPDASSFDATLYMQANGLSYLDGTNFDGGDFTTPLRFHNLTATTGTQISTDDVQFTGVEVKTEETDVHYPDEAGWNNYVMLVSENPFVEGHESNIAVFLYNKLSTLKFRPFSCQSIQDPTIEAGDCALVYDTKGNTYNSIITNVQFTTGGYTDLSCKAQSPIKQNSRYVNPAAQAVVQAEKKMDDYNAQVAHFNELASEALGYYKTLETDSSTGATITYIHNAPTIETSSTLWKITSDGIFISEDGGESYNSGYDASTGTMLMNLVYAHGLNCDWIRTGELDVGVGNNYNTGSIFRAFTDNVIATLTVDTAYVGQGINVPDLGLEVDSPLGIYVDNIGTGSLKGFATLQHIIDGQWSNAERIYLTSGYNEFTTKLDHTSVYGQGYFVYCYLNNGATYRARLIVSKLNTSIDGNGVRTNNLTLTGGTFSGATNMNLTSGSTTYDSTLNWGGTWRDSLTVVVNNNDDGGLGVAHTSDPQKWAVYMHYDEIQRYPGSYTAQYAQWGSSSSSDRRLKTNIRNLTSDILQKFYSKLNPIVFNYIKEENEDGTYFGVFAQDMEEALEEIGIDDSHIVYEDMRGYKHLSYCSTIGIQIGAVKDLYDIVNRQQEEINALKQRLTQLETIVNAKE